MSPILLSIDPAQPQADAVARAAEVLRRGGLVAFPTETVYGLGADAANPQAVRAVFAAKGRPADHPLIVHLPDASHLDAWARAVPQGARALADAFWPGPLTMILPRSVRASDAVTGGEDTVGVRVPAHAHDDHESIVYLIRGRMELVIGDETFVAQAGDAWRHPIGVPHSSVALEDCVAIEVKSPPRKTWNLEETTGP